MRSLRAPPIHAAIQDQVKRYIIDHRLRPGEKLPTEQQIAREIGVGRNAVREALRALESLGMIEVRRGAGRYVRQFNFDAFLGNLAYAIYFDGRTFDDLVEVRAELEVGFIARAMPTLEQDDLHELRRLVDGMRERKRAGQIFRDEDQAFHRRLFHKLGNQLLLQVLGVFWTVSVTLQATEGYPSRQREVSAEVCDQHEQIVEALVRRDAEAATAAMRYHFDYYHAARHHLAGASQAGVLAGEKAQRWPPQIEA